ncbi:uncharacterized protein (DUF58 family) [Microbacterium sp. W4I4]|uniref:DUF58 domain-containing protein n=1 Tax=Microbacterium sp. W4I4 TaxID=3042295 RepID=UPI00277FA5FF|nr:DUF58 domain-containing protein [Microbacterium sp. W4I4]MDQ0612513.1 uncharacterized protein (DUF58 family) [Microbacterium sp. W4I4]
MRTMDIARGSSRRSSPSTYLAIVGALGALVVGILLARPELIAVGLPFALWAVHALASPGGGTVHVDIAKVEDEETGRLSDDIVIRSDSEIVEVAVIQAERIRRRVFVAGSALLHSRVLPLHSGPLTSVGVAVRGLDADAGSLGAPHPRIAVTRTVQPVLRRLPRMPLAPRLTGLHGAHEGSRPGQGGDFRGINPFAPGDELRRVDWKATARAARRPGELLVRRTNSLSDASAVIVMDTADDLGAVVATWGSPDATRSGITSLDLARSAARSLAAATIDQGDRVAFHTLALGGRTVRSGGGRRHLARIVAEIAASGRAGDDARFRRTPPVPHGSIIYVLSTFFDGAAAEIAMRWRASGHRVVAVDTLPDLDRSRLTTERSLALDVLLAERQDMLHQLREAAVETVRWSSGIDGALAALARTGGTIAQSGARR